MTDEEFQEQMAQTKMLEQSGQHEEAVRILKTMVDGAPSIEDRLWAAGLVASIINFNYKHLVKPGTSQYADVHKYLRIALQCYDQAHPAAQELWRNMPNDIPSLRRVLSTMDRGQPVDLHEKKSGCFIATAAYGSLLAPEVLLLCDLRDEVLLQSVIGTAFVKTYYWISPTVASIIERSKVLRFMVRNLFVRPLVALIASSKKLNLPIREQSPINK